MAKKHYSMRFACEIKMCTRACVSHIHVCTIIITNYPGTTQSQWEYISRMRASVYFSRVCDVENFKVIKKFSMPKSGARVYPFYGKLVRKYFAAVSYMVERCAAAPCRDKADWKKVYVPLRCVWAANATRDRVDLR